MFCNSYCIGFSSLCGSPLSYLQNAGFPGIGAIHRLEKKARGAVPIETPVVGPLEEVSGGLAVALLVAGHGFFIKIDPVGAERGGLGAEQLVDHIEITPTLDPELPNAPGEEFPGHRSCNFLTHENAGAEGFVELLEPGGHVDGVSNEGVIDMLGAADVPSDDFPEMEADPRVQGFPTDPKGSVEMQLPRRADGLEDSPLVVEGDSPGGKDGVPDELDHDPLLLEDVVRSAFKVIIEMLHDEEWVRRIFAGRREVLDIGEHHRRVRFFPARVQLKSLVRDPIEHLGGNIAGKRLAEALLVRIEPFSEKLLDLVIGDGATDEGNGQLHQGDDCPREPEISIMDREDSTDQENDPGEEGCKQSRHRLHARQANSGR